MKQYRSYFRQTLIFIMQQPISAICAVSWTFFWAAFHRCSFLDHLLCCSLSGDDCMEMVHQLNTALDDDKAREWLDEAMIRNVNSDEELSSQISKFKLHYEYEDHLVLMNSQFPAYCREDLQPKATKFLCHLDLSQRILPVKVEVVSRAPSITLYHDVLGPKRRQDLINLTEGKLFRGPVALANGGRASEHRVARIATIEDILDEAIEHSARVTKQVTGFALSREMIVVKYDVGGKFDLYYDFALEYAHDIYSHLGTSFAEALTYLVDTEYGGELVFPAVPAVIKPSAGSMVVWRDTDEEGLNDFSTLHGACPVAMGEKWITARNFRAFGQEGTCMAALDSDVDGKIQIFKPEYSAEHAELEFESFKNSEEIFNFESRKDVENVPSDLRY
eukprot:GFUD01020690.1.p1 GENE.GFUD01020690.1~~GFUD01020690.1.p1  ORF type:complete len:390 (-),score=73.62 GFUD01020690.1:38-1207(-)